MESKKLIIGIIIISVAIASIFTIFNVSSNSNGYYGGRESAESSSFPSLSYRSTEEAAMEAPAPAAKTEYTSVEYTDFTEQKVIKTSYISLEVDNFKESAAEIETIARSHGGYVSDTSVRDIDGRKIGYVTIRVPEDAFEDAIGGVESVGTVKEENVSLEDVTEEYIDLQARLDNLERQEERYLEILDIATTVEDILKVESQLERVRGQIESLQGRLNYLNNRISLSTIQVNLEEPKEVVHESKIGEAFDRAIDAFLSAIRGIIIFLGYFLPVAIFLGIIIPVGLFLYRKISKVR
ncbi:MAG: DUF4349 domain-containing protein [Theionarchaea archaeon]|nr:DUF4349 domain-containing protein [Theionarchaea archaeon]